MKYMSRILTQGVSAADVGLGLAVCCPQTKIGFLNVAITAWPAYIVMLICALFINDEKKMLAVG
jgi:hypothetical protein